MIVENIDELHPDKLIVYTSVFGGYSDLLPQRNFEGVQFVCFTDTPEMLERRKSWTIIPTEAPIENDFTRSNRFFKLNPHKVLPNHELSVYMDGNFVALQNPKMVAEKVLAKHNMALFNHEFTRNGRNCIYREGQELIRLASKGNKKDDPEVVKSQLHWFRSEGYPENHGLVSGGVLIRRHHASDVIEAMNEWWSIVSTRSKRDQLSFNFVAWKLGFDYNLLMADVSHGNHYFYSIGNHRKDFDARIRKHRIKSLFGLKPKIF